MFESDARRPLAPAVSPVPATFEDEEPPSQPRRHAQWADVPSEQWDDWRWQTQNSIRSVRQLRHLLPFTADELEAIDKDAVDAGINLWAGVTED